MELSSTSETVPTASESASIRLRVLDSGPGPSPAMVTRLFEPFATSKPDGTGLGLSVAQEIAEAHSAKLMWHREGDLTCFEVVLAMPQDS